MLIQKGVEVVRPQIMRWEMACISMIRVWHRLEFFLETIHDDAERSRLFMMQVRQATQLKINLFVKRF